MAALLVAGACAPPRARAPIAPRFPEILRSAAVPGGEVRVVARVERAGGLRILHVTPGATMEAQPPVVQTLFAQAARSAVHAAGVAPGRRLGRAVGGRLEVRVRWVLLRPEGPRPANLPARFTRGVDSLPAACPRAADGAVVVCARADWPHHQVLYD